VSAVDFSAVGWPPSAAIMGTSCRRR